jgi:hypothetical protein
MMFKNLAAAVLLLLSTTSYGSPIILSDIPSVIDPANIISAGLKVWQVIADNKAVADLSSSSASALPKGLTEWQQIVGWQTNSSEVFQYNVKDPLGIGMVSYKYRLIYNYGGKLSVNGVTGQYIADLRVQPDSVWVNVGNHFDTSVSVSDNVLNVGTAENPIAGMTVVHRMHFHNWNRDTVQEDTYIVRADGLYKKV